MAAAAAAVVLVAAGFGAWQLLRDVPAAGDGDTDRLAGVVDLIVAGFDCARIEATLSEDRRVELSGFVASESDRDRLRTSLAAIDGVSGVGGTLAVRPWPFCEYLGILADHAALDPERGRPLVALNHDDATYATGDTLVVRVTASDSFDSYLYVDYVDRDGGVIHMLPEPLRPQNVAYAGQLFVLGTDAEQMRPNERQWIVAQPAGTKMIVVLTAPVPLFDDLRPVQETAAEYFPDLRDSLEEIARLGGSELLPATFTFLETTAAAASSR